MSSGFSLKKFASFIKYMISSGLCFFTDIGLFTLINMGLGYATDKNMVSLSENAIIFIATAGARVVSSIVNYMINRKVVFKSDSSVKSSLVRYYSLAVCQLLLSYLLVSGISISLLGLKKGSFAVTVIKMIVDVGLFVVSYQIQRRWVFKTPAGKDRASAEE